MKHSRTSALIVVAVTASSLVACKKKESAAIDSAAGRVDSAAVVDSAKQPTH